MMKLNAEEEKNSLKIIAKMKARFFILGPLGVLALLGLSGCEGQPIQADSSAPSLSVQTKNSTIQRLPKWVNGQVKQGVVCSQNRGIYSRAKAAEMAINSCLIQLADKQITGQAIEHKTVSVVRGQSGENVRIESSSQNQYQVKTVAGSQHLGYDLLGKYYDVAQEKMFVWVKLH